jgi:hypothetical protein
MTINDFTKEDLEKIDQIHGYGEQIFIDDLNQVRWKTTNQLVEAEVLRDLYQYGYISANMMMTTAVRNGEYGEF